MTEPTKLALELSKQDIEKIIHSAIEAQVATTMKANGDVGGAMSDEQTRRIQQLEAELVATGRACAKVVRDLKDAGHDDMAKRVQARCDAAAYEVPLALATLRDAEETPRLRDRLKAAEQRIDELQHEKDGARRAWARLRADGHHSFKSGYEVACEQWGVEEALRLFPLKCEGDDGGVGYYEFDDREQPGAKRERHRREIDAKAGDMQDRIARNLFGDDVVDGAKREPEPGMAETQAYIRARGGVIP